MQRSIDTNIYCIFTIMKFGNKLNIHVKGFLLSKSYTPPIKYHAAKKKYDVCMVRPLKMPVLLLFVHLLLDQCLLHLHPTQKSNLPAYLPHAPANDCSSFRAEHRHADSLSKGRWESCSSVGFPGNWWTNLRSIPPITGIFPPTPAREDYCHVLPVVCCTGWDVTQGPHFRHVRSSIH